MKKIHQLLVSGAILLSVNGAVSSVASTLNAEHTGVVHAAVLGDNYPSKWKKGSGIDYGICMFVSAHHLSLSV